MTNTPCGQTSASTCKVCGSGELAEIEGLASLPRVTSDCRPFQPGGRLAICCRCGQIQKFADARWLAEIEGIYSNYQVYHQSGGAEQRVALTGGDALAMSRSERLVDHLARHCLLTDEGSLLDVGCGNGSFLRTFAQRKPNWQLDGAELDDRHAGELASIPGFNSLHCGGISSIGGLYHAVVMIHALEHMTTPLAMLCDLHRLIAADGHLVIQVPNIVDNPFDLVIADHLLHFDAHTLSAVLARAGFSATVSNTVVAKELTAQAHLARSASTPVPVLPIVTRTGLKRRVAWLANIIEQAERLAAADGSVAIFGTSIGGTWLGGHIADHVQVFVDEDPSRVGRELMGKPVVSPADVPANLRVFMPMAPHVARVIADRVDPLGQRYIPPPALDEQDC